MDSLISVLREKREASDVERTRVEDVQAREHESRSRELEKLKGYVRCFVYILFDVFVDVRKLCASQDSSSSFSLSSTPVVCSLQ